MQEGWAHFKSNKLYIFKNSQNCARAPALMNLESNTSTARVSTLASEDNRKSTVATLKCLCSCCYCFPEHNYKAQSSPPAEGAVIGKLEQMSLWMLLKYVLRNGLKKITDTCKASITRHQRETDQKIRHQNRRFQLKHPNVLQMQITWNWNQDWKHKGQTSDFHADVLQCLIKDSKETFISASLVYCCDLML